MTTEPKYGATLNGWERLLASMEANAQDFPALDAYRAQLKTLLDTARESSKQQSAMEASKQEATKQLKSLLADGRKLATFLRGGVKQRYGNRAEKLVEFGLSPLRPKAKATGAAQQPSSTPPPAPTPTPHPPTA